MNSDERAARRTILRVARVLIGCVIVVAGAGAALWLRAAFHPWTDAGNPDARAPHAVLHLVNESGAPIALAWRCVPLDVPASDEAGAAPVTRSSLLALSPWIELPPLTAGVPGRVERSGFRLLAPIPPRTPSTVTLPDDKPPGDKAGSALPMPAPTPAEPRATARVELRVVIGAATLLGSLPSWPGQHARLRIDSHENMHIATGDSNWLGAPRFGDEQLLVTRKTDVDPPQQR